MKGIICFITTVLIICSCKEDKQLSYALEVAKNNKTELNKVLEYYKNDSLKLKAACFLIKNMPYYYSYEGWQLDTMKQIIANKSITKEVSQKNLYKWGNFAIETLNKSYDSQVISADYLIKNIDLSFKIWRSRPWSKYYSFDDFCNYILPYRIGYEPLESWREIYYKQYSYILDSIYKGSDVVEACNYVSNQLLKEGFYDNEKSEFQLPNLGAMFFLKNRVGTCKESCDFTLYVMRALGIPVATDQLYYLPGLRSIHYWNIVKDTTGQIVPFWFAEDGVRRGNDDKRKKRKIYRNFFAVQPELISNISGDKEVFQTFKNRFIKDVTNEYFENNSIVITLKEKRKNRWVYLGGFAPVGWVPVTLAHIKDKEKVIFHNVEPNLIYQLLIQTPNGLQPLESPFFYYGKSIRYFHADTSHWVNAKLIRKCASSARLEKHLNNIVRGRFELSNTSDFKQANTLYSIDKYTYAMYNRIMFTKPYKCRYIRYVPAPNKTAELAELYFYSDTIQSLPIPYKPYQYDSLAFVDIHRNFNLVSDNDPLSYIESKENGNAIIFDFGKIVSISSFMYTPRNDDNFIRIGDLYELVYQDKNSNWISLGKKTAQKDTLYYKTPKGALLWLKNLTRGTAEELFEYKNNTQIFL